MQSCFQFDFLEIIEAKPLKIADSDVNRCYTNLIDRVFRSQHKCRCAFVSFVYSF